MTSYPGPSGPSATGPHHLVPEASACGTSFPPPDAPERRKVLVRPKKVCDVRHAALQNVVITLGAGSGSVALKLGHFAPRQVAGFATTERRVAIAS